MTQKQLSQFREGEVPAEPPGPLTISISYDKTTLTLDETFYFVQNSSNETRPERVPGGLTGDQADLHQPIS